MRLLSASAMMTIVEASPEDREAALAGISPLVDVKQLERLTAEGFLKAVIVRENEQPKYIVWLNATVDGGMHINAALALVPHTNGELLVRAIEYVARAKGCSFLRFNTKRVGMISRAKEFGFVPDSVTMVKRLS